MRFGVSMFFTDQTIGPDELGREAEARGFDGLYMPEHTHIPVSRRTPAPMGEPLPEWYRRILDPFVALTAAAAATERLRVGTAICLLAQRDAIVTAKEIATLDHLSGGRFVFGIGFGWNREEMEAHGVPYERRREMVREKVLAMKGLWTQEEASFDGEWVRYERAWAWPKPAQKPHPPVLLGGAPGPKLFGHIAEWADGWMPIGGRGVAKALPDLRIALEARGRDPDRIEIVPVGSVPEPGKLEYFASIGVTETVIGLPTAGRDAVLRDLDRSAEVVAPFRG